MEDGTGEIGREGGEHMCGCECCSFMFCFASSKRGQSEVGVQIARMSRWLNENKHDIVWVGTHISQPNLRDAKQCPGSFRPAYRQEMKQAIE